MVAPRKEAFKKGVDANDSRRRREDTSIQLRKQKREEGACSAWFKRVSFYFLWVCARASLASRTRLLVLNEKNLLSYRHGQAAHDPGGWRRRGGGPARHGQQGPLGMEDCLS